MVVMMGHKIWGGFYGEIWKLSLNFPCYPFFSGALRCCSSDIVEFCFLARLCFCDNTHNERGEAQCLAEFVITEIILISPVGKYMYRQAVVSPRHLHGHGGMLHTVKFCGKVFLCDGQDTVRQAILYVDRFCSNNGS